MFSPSLPSFPSTLMRCLKNSAKLLVLKTLSSTGLEQSIPKLEVTFLSFLLMARIILINYYFQFIHSSIQTHKINSKFIQLTLLPRTFLSFFDKNILQLQSVLLKTSLLFFHYKYRKMHYSSFQQQVSQDTQRQIQNFKKIQEFIEELHQKIVKLSKINEEKILQSYKEEMETTKTQFNRLCKERNDEIIQKAIMNQKQVLEKQCAVSIKKSLKIAKIYENLHIKWKNMHTCQHQMNLEKQFLKREIRKAEKLNQSLNSHLDEVKTRMEKKIIERQTKKPTLICPLPTKSDIFSVHFNSTDNIQSKKDILFSSFKKDKETLNKTEQFKCSLESRLKQRIEAKKQYLETISYNESTLQQIFNQYAFDQCTNSKEKMMLLEKILSEKKTKQVLYKLLFGRKDKQNLN